MTTGSIKDAILRSISHNEIAKVEVEWPKDSRSAEETILDILDDIEGVDEPDTAQENDGSYDVWGKLNGADFRIRIHLAAE
jgi:hypothetical protein